MRQQGTFISPTGGYVVAAVVDGDTAAWTHLVETLSERGYALDGVDGDGHGHALDESEPWP